MVTNGRPFTTDATEQVRRSPHLAETLHAASLATVTGDQHGLAPHLALQANARKGVLGAVFRNAEDRRHENTIAETEHRGREGALGLSIAGALATGFAMEGIENEVTMEAALVQNQHSQMAMAAAPMYITLSREMYTRHGREIADSVSGRVSRIVGGR